MIVWIIVLGIVAAGMGLVVGAGMYQRRMDEKVADTADWLETEATIQEAVIERLDKYTWLPGFAFSYSAKGEYFSGKFFLKADHDQSEELIKTVVHQKFPVQYDADDPSAWFIAEKTIAGCEIIQKLSADYPSETGMYRSDGDAPIDLHIN
jgi:hypothetical protein